MTTVFEKIIPFILVLCVVLGDMPSSFCEPLQGGISVSKALPAVPGQLKEGCILKEENLPPMGTFQDWIQIPRWSAGTWHRETQTDFLPGGPQTEISRTVNEQQKGHQLDSRGGIWNHLSLPSKNTVDSDQYTNWQIATQSESMVMNETETVGRVRFVSIYVNKSNGRIAKVLQQEEIKNAHPDGPGKAYVDVRKTIYDENGRLLDTINSHANYVMIRPFMPIPIDPETGLDLHQDFKNYLLSHGLSNLVPIDQSF